MNGHRTATLERPRAPQTDLIKVGILAGIDGSRLAEEGSARPKAMVEIGDRPMLWHIMQHFRRYGFKDFVVALGAKGEHVKRYMLDYATLSSNLNIDLSNGVVRREGMLGADWRVELVDTGIETMTGGRIKRLQRQFGSGTFMLAWGDSVSDVDLDELLSFHRSHGRLATVMAGRPAARFGKLDIVRSQVVEFAEKPEVGEGWVSGGFLVLETGVFDYIDGDDTQWEREPMERLAAEGELMAFKHLGFWQSMDTLRDKRLLESLWQSGEAPWKTWQQGAKA